MFFSRTDSAETFCKGKAVSIRDALCLSGCGSVAYIAWEFSAGGAGVLYGEAVYTNCAGKVHISPLLEVPPVQPKRAL
jgi:hypothetical protein